MATLPHIIPSAYNLNDLESLIRPEALKQIARTLNLNTDTVAYVDVALRAIGEVQAHMARYDIYNLFYDKDENGDENPDFVKSYYLIDITKRVIVWKLIQVANPNVDYDKHRLAYDDAIEQLEKIAKGLIVPADWPLAPAPDSSTIVHTGDINYYSNPKRRNHF